MKRLLIILAVLVALGAAGIYRLVRVFLDGKDAGDTAAAAFHSHYNAGNPGAIYDDADVSLRSTVTREEFVRSLTACHGQTGAFVESSSPKINISNQNGYKTLEISHTATWDKNSGTELLLFDYNGNQPRLLRCEIDSPALQARLVLPPSPAAVPDSPSSRIP